MVEAQVERTYGNWRRPRPPGLWHLGLISSVLLIVGLIAAIIVIALVGLIPGLVVLALMLPLFLVTLRPDPHGQTPMQRVGMKLGWRRARASRAHLYRSGPLGRTPYGTFQLCPGCSPQASSLKRGIAMTGRSRCCATRGASS
jgi:hypothetical protein